MLQSHRKSYPVTLPERCAVAKPDASLNLELAGRTLDIRGMPAGWDDLLPGRLLDCRIHGPRNPDRVVEITKSTREDLRPSGSSRDLNESTALGYEKTGVNFRSDWCAGWFEIAPQGAVRVEVHRDAKPWFGGIVENVVRLLTAYDVLNDGGVMLHCAGIVRDNRAAILFGHSGAGKSTCSELALKEGCSVISDDINVIEHSAGGWQVVPVPFSGSLNRQSDIRNPVPVDGLYRLRQSELDIPRHCSMARSIALLAGSAPFVNQDPLRAGRLVETLTRLAGDLPVRELHFTRSPMFLQNVFHARNPEAST
jgi:hypothetical protein